MDRKQHDCSQDLPTAAYGAAITACEEDDDGGFWAGNGEYESQVNFCPFCGEKAPKQIATVAKMAPEEDDIYARIEAELTEIVEIIAAAESIHDDPAVIALVDDIRKYMNARLADFETKQ